MKKISHNLIFRKCARGFVVHDDQGHIGMMSDIYAFDRIEDVVAWLLRHFGNLENNQD